MSKQWRPGQVIEKGIAKTVLYAEAADGDCPARDFLQSLGEDAREKFEALFERMAQHGKITNTEKFKKLEGTKSIFEFKSDANRILCFLHDDKCVVLTHGVVKKKWKLHPQDIARAELILKNYTTSKEGFKR